MCKYPTIAEFYNVNYETESPMKCGCKINTLHKKKKNIVYYLGVFDFWERKKDKNVVEEIQWKPLPSLIWTDPAVPKKTDKYNLTDDQRRKVMKITHMTVSVK